MKKRTAVKKAAAVVSAAAMAVMSVAGCGAGETEQSKTEGNEAEGSVQNEQRMKVSDIEFPLKEKVTLTAFVNEGRGDYRENYFTYWLEEKTNVHLDFVYDVAGDEAKTKLNLLMTDPDSLPDIFISTGWSKSEVLSYGKQGLILALDEYLKDAENWNRLNETSPRHLGDLTMADGHVYTYGDVSECTHCEYMNRMWIYKPWVDSLNGGKIPETLDELYEFLEKVKNEDPNGNGKADEIPVSGFIGGWCSDPTVWFINSFLECNNQITNSPAAGSGFIVEDGKIQYQVMKDEYREAVRFLNKLYKEGILDQQTFTQDENQYKAILNGEEPLAALHAGGGVVGNQEEFHSRPLEERRLDWYALEPVEGPNGIRLAARNDFGYFNSGNGIVSANCEYPEIAVALFDFMASMEATITAECGPQGVKWDWVTEGESLGGEEYPVQWASLDRDMDNIDWIGEGFDRKWNKDKLHWASEGMVAARDAVWRLSRRSNGEMDNEQLLESSAARYRQWAPPAETLVPNLAFAEEDAQAVSEYTVTIGGYVNQALVQFIIGEMDIEKDWDTYLGKLKDMGVEQYIEIFQKNYDVYAENLK